MVQTTETAFEQTELKSDGPYLDSLLPALQRLDRRLEEAVAAAQTVYGPEATTDRYRGLYISQDEVDRLLAREPGVPIFQANGSESKQPLPDPAGEASRLRWLQQTFGLSLCDLDLILIALAPELDRRYERLYAYLQDHVSHRRPSVDLALNLLCSNAAERLERRVHFAADAPLIRHGLIHLISDTDQPHPSLLAHTLKLDDQIIRLILGQKNLDARLAPFCQIVESSIYLGNLPLSVEVRQTLPSLVIAARKAHQPLRLYFYGPPGVGKRHTAEALAHEVGAPLLVADLTQVLASKIEFEQFLRLLFREAWFQDAVLYLTGLEAIHPQQKPFLYQQLLAALSQDSGITILTGTQPWLPTTPHPLGVVQVPFSIPDFAQRRDFWLAQLVQASITISATDLDALAGRFSLTAAQIAEIVATAQYTAWLHTAAQTADLLTCRPTADELFAAARAQSGHDMATLARKIEPVYSWDDIVLPEDALAQLHEMCQRVAHRHHVLDEWGFSRKLALGKGVNALFAGPSGTGKTMAAEIVANELGLDLYKIDLSGVVSKYIGETEKNLSRIFQAAENANAILFFDEADALFGKRSEVRDSHDRYANIEISYLLQKMEEYEGLSILTTNLHRNMDDAFVRRLTFTVHFPFPDEASRCRIWESVWPVEIPLADDVDLNFLARQFKLAGGNIKNVALAAAFLAVEADSSVTMNCLLQATRREYQKMGKTLSEEELKGA